jgi:hypothetical protein
MVLVSVTVTPSGGALSVRISGASDRFLALSSGFDVPLHAIRSVEILSREDAKPQGLRVAGAYVPNRVWAGRFRITRGQKDFYLVRRGERLLCVVLEGARYSRLVLEVADVDEIAHRLRSLSTSPKTTERS